DGPPNFPASRSFHVSDQSQSFLLESELEPDLAADIEKQGAFVSPDIRKVRVRHGNRISYELSPTADPNLAHAKLSRYVVRMVSSHRPLPRKAVGAHRRKDPVPLVDDAYSELVRRGWVLELGRGQVGLRGPALRLARALDAEWARIGVDAF